MYLKVLPFILALSMQAAFGQNIVENGSFEELTGKLKEPGTVFLAQPWVAGTQSVPDLYAPKAKDPNIRIPINAYGDQEPKDGENYAGFLAYSHGAKEARSYLTAKLKYPMLAGEWYCVKFHVSFADLSKYASDNIGAYISHDSVGSEKDLILSYNPQIINSGNRIFEKQWDWEDICRIYPAEGGEQFITIGNFSPQAETKVKSVKRPSGYTKTQIRDGYYYIDDISITPNATKENCKCEPGQFQFAHLEKEESSFETAAEDIPEKVILSTTSTILTMEPTIEKKFEDVIINFQKAKSNLSSAETAKLNEVASILKKNNEVTIEVIGHRDGTESVLKDLSYKRAAQVSKYLVSRGIDKERMTVSDAGSAEAYDDDFSTKEMQAKNMTVEVVFSE